MVSGKCLSCSEYLPNCKSCQQVNNLLVCLQCQPAYYLVSGSACLPCMGSCSDCTNGTSCSKCNQGYYYNGKACTACSQSNCYECTVNSTVNKCTYCAPGTYLQKSTGTCETCTSGCDTCSSPSICLVCSEGYYSYNKGCLPCSS